MFHGLLFKHQSSQYKMEYIIGLPEKSGWVTLTYLEFHHRNSNVLSV